MKFTKARILVSDFTSCRFIESSDQELILVMSDVTIHIILLSKTKPKISNLAELKKLKLPDHDFNTLTITKYAEMPNFPTWKKKKIQSSSDMMQW